MDENTELRQMERKKQLQEVQEHYVNPPHFSWPSSKPGPESTPPPPGQKPLPARPEQMVEVGYNQESGVPATDDPRKWYADEAKAGAVGFDQQNTAQEVARKKRKKELPR